MTFKGDPSYDEIVRMREALVPGMDHRELHALFERLMWHEASTPEAVLAAQLVERVSYSEKVPRTETVPRGAADGTYTLAVRWPWGDARGLLRAKGRTWEEARLRLRDALVASARKVVA